MEYLLWEPYWLICACLTLRLETFRMWDNEYMTYPVSSCENVKHIFADFVSAFPIICLGAVHILRKHIFGSLNTLGGVVSAW